MVDRWVAVKKVVKSLYLKWIDHFYSLLIEVSFESICNDSLIVAQIMQRFIYRCILFETKKDALGILIAFYVLMLIHPAYIE